MRTLLISVFVALTLLVTSCSGISGKEDGLQSDNLSALSSGITAANWEEQVGYDRLRVLVGGILKDWRNQGIEIEAFFENPDVEAEFWTELVLIYFTEEEGRYGNLLDAMNWIRDNQDLIKEQGEAALGDISNNISSTESIHSSGENLELSIDAQLVEAINSGDTKAVEQMLSQGADPNAVDEYGASALQLAIFRGDFPSDMPDPDLINTGQKIALEMVELLLAKGADPNAQSSDQSALIAAGLYLPQACIPLLEAGAEVNATDRLGNTVLFYLLKDEQLFAALLKHGADPDLKNNEGETVYDEIRKQNATGIAKILNMELQEQLVTPVNPYATSVFEKVHKGINQKEAIDLFGTDYIVGEDEMDGSEVWEYVVTAKGYKRPTGDFGSIDFEGLEAGKMKMHLFIHWNEDQSVWYSSVYVLGPEKEVYVYYINPGDQKTVGQPL